MKDEGVAECVSQLLRHALSERSPHVLLGHAVVGVDVLIECDEMHLRVSRLQLQESRSIARWCTGRANISGALCSSGILRGHERHAEEQHVLSGRGSSRGRHEEREANWGEREERERQIWNRT